MLSGNKDRYLLVHVGSPKTGTTSIQEVLNHNAATLKQSHGINYPLDHNQDANGRQANGAILMPAYFDDLRLRTLFDSWFSESTHVLLSDEVLFLDRNCRSLKKLRNETVGVGVICYLRDAASYLTSIWAEFNRFENRINAPNFENFVGQNTYIRNILNLLDVVYARPEFEFCVRPYPGFSKDNDVVSDFLGLLDVTLDKDTITTSRTNISITRKEADIRQLQLMHEWPIADKLNSARVSKIAKMISSGDDRSVVETISDEAIERMCLDHAFFLNQTLRLGAIEQFDFRESFPRCFGKIREPYCPIHPGEYEKLKELLMEPLSYPDANLDAGNQTT